jgi:hypothetical protein
VIRTGTKAGAISFVPNSSVATLLPFAIRLDAGKWKIVDGDEKREEKNRKKKKAARLL